MSGKTLSARNLSTPSQRTCVKVIDEQGTLCGKPTAVGTQSKFCEQHRRIKTASREKKTVAPGQLHVNPVMIQQARSEFLAEALSLQKLMGHQEALFCLIDALKVLISRIGKSDYPEEEDE